MVPFSKGSHERRFCNESAGPRPLLLLALIALPLSSGSEFSEQPDLLVLLRHLRVLRTLHAPACRARSAGE